MTQSEQITAFVPNSDSPESKEKTTGDKNNWIWQGNFTIYWLLCTVLLLWFTLGRGMGYFGKADVLVGFHLSMAMLTGWIMAWNLFHSPSHGPIYRSLHRWLGRASLLTGLVSTICGFLIVWVKKTSSQDGASFGVGFSIGISVGGVLQVLAQFMGFYYIKRGLVQKHKYCMHGAFFGGCLIPAIMRLPHLIGVDIPSWYYWCYAIPLVLGVLSKRAVDAKRWY
ncbi:hypothetical protein HDV03_003379 [Kappamyces sp. JEL0829]|nr:hypothetical protein HDV03_003379 [Kappamyces sp. JEL0829]